VTELFQKGEFTLHSGRRSSFKIECDALTPEEWDTLAFLALAIAPGSFSDVRPIPEGGKPFARAILRQMDQLGWVFTPDAPLLVVDDVWTTGRSFEEYRASQPIDQRVSGVVAFARSPVASWVRPVFQLHDQAKYL
jgi:orotate phosphoribosyltransferase